MNASLKGYTCPADQGQQCIAPLDNPDYGFNGFDNYGEALLYMMQVLPITQSYRWADPETFQTSPVNERYEHTLLPYTFQCRMLCASSTCRGQLRACCCCPYLFWLIHMHGTVPM